MAEAANPQTLSFQAETQKLMELMVHALYSHREVFLRELISNASDALDKLRFELLSAPDLASDGAELQIRLEIDEKARTLSIADNGIGMSREELIENIGTIAKSGTRELFERLKQRAESKEGGDLPEDLIGQFGVGFYSAFMVADRVTLVTRRAGQTGATQWESDGKGAYTLSEATRAGQGTTVTLHLRDADEGQGLADFSDAYVVGETVKKYSDFIRYPIVLAGETLNSMKAIWRKRKGEVTDEEYADFYKHLSHDWEAPLKTISVRAEGLLEYSALLYLPGRAPFDMFQQARTWGPTLYVKNVRIMEHCEELLPRHLRFVQGVVDSSDLPLNVSRELLQQHGQLRVLKTGLTKKVLDALAEMQRDEPDNYRKFWEQFGPVLKEGLTGFAAEHRDKLLPLVLFHSSHDEQAPTALADYVTRMPAEQTEIYYATGANRAVVANSPHLEAFAKRGFEVLYLTDPIDEFVVQSLTEYEGKKLRSVAMGELAMSDEAIRRELEDKSKEYSGVLLKLQKKLGEHIKDARLTARLTTSPVCLVGGEHDMSAHLSRLLRMAKQDVPEQLRIMEINPDHAICQRMKALYRENANDPVLDDYAELLLGLGLLAEGTLPPEPAHFTRLVAQLMARN